MEHAHQRTSRLPRSIPAHEPRVVLTRPAFRFPADEWEYAPAPARQAGWNFTPGEFHSLRLEFCESLNGLPPLQLGPRRRVRKSVVPQKIHKPGHSQMIGHGGETGVTQTKVLCEPKALCQPLGLSTTLPRVTHDSSGAPPLERVNQEPATQSHDVRLWRQSEDIYTEQGRGKLQSKTQNDAQQQLLPLQLGV